MWTFLGIVGMAAGLFFLFNWLMGYRKGHMQIDLDERYMNHSEYIQAVKKKLIEEGHEVSYQGDYKFLIDGRLYVFIERNVPMGGVPLQRTILKPIKKL
ncbi:hypothetical protein [Halobacillus litoralis]|uniref:hypothetical protein n=1 Tax=Halobacillus litoralis TaxID=45668 RepID=UPI001CFE0A72|nr:hypothetical protein [Halobacillus litoralis]